MSDIMSEPLVRDNNNNNNDDDAPSSSAPPSSSLHRRRPPSSQQVLANKRRPENIPLDHAARVYSGLAMALVIPTTITMLIIVWTLQSLGPVDNRQPSAGPSASAAPVSTSADPIFVVNKETPDKSTGEKIGGALLNMLIVVGAITVITFVMVILYKYGYAKVLYVWLGLSAALIFFFLSAIYIDLVATRYQIPYDYVMMAMWVWNFGVVGILSVFYMGHPLMSQAYLIVVSIVVAWGLSQTPEWTTWALLVGVACYDIAAVLCPNGPLKLLVEAAQERQEPIPGFVYDSEAGPAMELTERPRPPPKPSASANHGNYNNEESKNNTREAESAGPSSRSQTPSQNTNNNFVGSIPVGDEEPSARNPLDDILGNNNNNNNEQPSTFPTAETSTTTSAPSSSAQPNRPPPKPSPKPQNANNNKKEEEKEEEEEEDPFEAAHNASSFKLGLGDFIFYSLLVGRAAMTFDGTQTPWLICYVCIICGMGGTLASLLFLRGKVPALPALPFSIFAATAAFFITRYLTLPYWDFLTLYAMTP